MKTVLHITEAFGGGIQTALCSYARTSKNDPVKHILLARLRPKDDTGTAIQSLFSEVKTVEGGLFTFYLAARDAVKEFQPDVIHLHSSYAGFLGRFVPKGHAQMVYTPHCYSFERQDISPLMQRAYKRLESLALSRIDVIAGCSVRECELALRLARHVPYISITMRISVKVQVVAMWPTHKTRHQNNVHRSNWWWLDAYRHKKILSFY